VRLRVYNRVSFKVESRYFGDDSELLVVPVEVLKRVGEGWFATREQVLVPLSSLASPFPLKKENPMSKQSIPQGRGTPVPPLAKDPSSSHLPPHPGTGVPKNSLPPKK
jgi:hypothetical protein